MADLHIIGVELPIVRITRELNNCLFTHRITELISNSVNGLITKM
jgi:hypothetical protein